MDLWSESVTRYQKNLLRQQCISNVCICINDKVLFTGNSQFNWRLTTFSFQWKRSIIDYFPKMILLNVQIPGFIWSSHWIAFSSVIGFCKTPFARLISQQLSQNARITPISLLRESNDNVGIAHYYLSHFLPLWIGGILGSYSSLNITSKNSCLEKERNVFVKEQNCSIEKQSSGRKGGGGS